VLPKPTLETRGEFFKVLIQHRKFDHLHSRSSLVFTENADAAHSQVIESPPSRFRSRSWIPHGGANVPETGAQPFQDLPGHPVTAG
jgi:hypothetical protein